MQLALFDEPSASVPARAKHRDVVGADTYSLARAKPDRREARVEPERREPEGVDPLDRAVEHFERNAYADATRRNYQRDWNAFVAWCHPQELCALPAAVDTLRRYLAHLATSGYAYSTIRHARSSIGLAHAHARLPRPDEDERIRMLERGIARAQGGREVGVQALLEHEVAQAAAALGEGVHADRDRALLLLGFAGAFRASDLAGLDMDSYRMLPDGGVRIRLRRSKEDALGNGSYTDVPKGMRAETCPVAALRVWAAQVGRASGPLFRVVSGARITHERISTRAVARAVQRATARAGLEGHFAAHSLRSGLATSAYAAGATEREIQAHGRWKDRRSLDRYIHVERLPRGRNVAAGLL
jgi:site-specific recombinase XerD